MFFRGIDYLDVTGIIKVVAVKVAARMYPVEGGDYKVPDLAGAEMTGIAEPGDTVFP